MKKKNLTATEKKMNENVEAEKQQMNDQTAEEFMQDKADWSEDISEYRKKHKKRTK